MTRLSDKDLNDAADTLAQAVSPMIPCAGCRELLDARKAYIVAPDMDRLFHKVCATREAVSHDDAEQLVTEICTDTLNVRASSVLTSYIEQQRARDADACEACNGAGVRGYTRVCSWSGIEEDSEGKCAECDGTGRVVVPAATGPTPPVVRCNRCGSGLRLTPRDSKPDISWYAEPCDCASDRARVGEHRVTNASLSESMRQAEERFQKRKR
jgi:hypothetical protein